VAQRTDDPPTNLLEHCRNVGIAGWLALEKARLAALVGPIKIDPLKEDDIKMDIYIERTAKALDKRHRPRMRFLPLDAACHRLVDIVLTDCRADDRMEFRRQVLRGGHPIEGHGH
jgi:hypothetical protein